MAYRPNDKIDIASIFIQSVEGPASSARVTSLEAANSVLQGWAHGKSGATPDECEVEIVFEDGLRYCGHYRLREESKAISLGRHVRRRLAAMAKMSCAAKRPQPVANAADDAIICPDERDPIECAREIIAHYNI